MSDYDQGDLAEVELELTDLAGEATDAETVSIEIKAPDGTSETHVFGEDGYINHAGLGLYSAHVSLDQPGRWNYRWESDDPQSAEEGTFTVGPSRVDPDGTAYPEWAPDLTEIGALLRARTKDDVGNELRTFTDATRPTADDVNALIVQAVADVQGLFTGDVPETSFTLCRRAAALRTALNVEISYFPEQGADNSPYLQLRQLSDASIQQVIKRAVWLDAFSEDPLPTPRP